MMEAGSADRVAQSEELNFVAFAQDPAYRETNRQLLTRVLDGLPSPFFHIDVASGTGLVAQEMCALCEKHGRTGTVIGIDPDGFAVESASATTPSTAHCTVEFVQGKAQDLHQLLAGKIPTDGVDYVSIHDALHEIDEADKQDVIRSMVDVLRPGGLFSYNSAFTTIAMDECPMVWGRIKSKAISILGGKRDRNAQGFVVHTPEEYRQMLVDAGLAVIHEARRSVMMSRAALEAIARYPQFAFGVFVDMVGTEQVSIQQKSQAIIQAIHELGVTESLRIWHEIVAQKPARA